MVVELPTAHDRMGLILTVCHWWIVALWAVMLIYWAIAAFSIKRGSGRGLVRQGWRFRLVLLVLIVVAIDLAGRFTDLRALQWAVLHSDSMAVTGAIVATLGAALAFSARAAIGRNWGTPAMRRTDTDLVTSGPYALVRHPIYSGILLMMIGTAIGLVLTWWLVAAAAAVYFVASARAEERHMAERFPDSYPAYQARTKMLVPFLL